MNFCQNSALLILVLQQIMSQRFTQEQKFKNITLKLQQIPMHTSNIVRTSTTNVDRKDNYRPSTPINSSKYIMHEGQNLNIEIITSQIANNQRASPNALSPKARSQTRKRLDYQQQRFEDKNDENQQLIRQLEQKEEIIYQLKNIIKLSNQNNSRIKPKSLYQSQKSPDRERTHQDQQKQLKQLRHNVKVLTIQNNALSGYIDKLKNQMNQREFSQNTYNPRKVQRQSKQSATLQQLRQKNESLKEQLRQKQYRHQKKIDEYISTYKSLANQCQRLQQQKEIAEAQNQRLASMLRDLEQTHRKATNREDDKLGKTSEKTSLIKIKQQYAQSVRQIRETINIQFENLFQNFRMVLNQIEKNVSYMERRIKKLEQQLRHKHIQHLKASREATKKSEIYIQQGSQSFASENSARKHNLLKSVVVSRLYEQNHKNSHNEEQLLRPLQQEIVRLKEVISDLQNQMSERSDYYTFRQKYESSQAQIQSYRTNIIHKQQQLKTKEREMIYQINTLKQQIGKLQKAYRQQKKNNQQRFQEELDYKDQRINDLSNQLHDIRQKYDECLDQMKSIITAKRTDQVLSQEINHLRQENEQYIRKIDQYKKLVNLLQEETQENTINYELFDQMKKQIFQIKEKYNFDLLKFNATEKQNRQILIANQQFKQKLEYVLTNNKKLQQDLDQLKRNYKQISTEKQELVQRVNYNEKVIKILQNQIKAKKDIQISLIQQKNALQKQLINYLSIFNKLTFEEIKYSSRKGTEQELGIQDLLDKLSKLQASYNDLHSSRREKRQIITRLMNESIDQIQLSSIKRKGRQ